MDVSAHFRFYPVGQGCFYTGSIDYRSRIGRPFNFVYDCGTLSSRIYLDEAIDQYKHWTTELDLVIISHFDKDHVNGITRLLRGLNCRRLVIPYYETLERLLLYVADDGTDGDYLEMLRDPLTFFGGDRFRIQEIVVITGDDDTELTQRGIQPTNDRPPRSSFSDELYEDSEVSDKGWEFDDQGEEGDPEVLIPDYYLRINQRQRPALKVIRTPYRMTVWIWEFYFYYRRYNASSARDIAKRKRISLITNEVDALVTTIKAELPEEDRHSFRFSDLFSDAYINRLRIIYENVFGAHRLNVTSLATYHGPLINVRKFTSHSCHRPDNFGTLLLGDIEINKPDTFQQFYDYYQPYWQDVCVFQMPHHGARANWPLKPIRPELHGFCQYIINHGLGRRHHPGKEVIDDLKTNCLDGWIRLNNEVSACDYHLYYPLD